MITIPSLNDVTDILDTDMIMVTQQSGQSYKIAGSELNKRGKIIIANSTTITGAPLKAGSSVRVYFTVDLTAANASTTLQLNYNNVNYYVKAPKDGTLINFVATNMGGSPAVFKYLQKYTTLELLFDGTQFVIIGNPVILSSADYTIYADGLKRVDTVIKNSKDMITSGEVYKYLFNNVMQKTFNSEGWLQLGVFSKSAYGSVIKLQLSSVYINSRNSQREITICAGFDDIVISELVLDQVGVFDKIRLCKTESGGNYYILVHYTPNTENHVLLSVNVSSYDTQIIIPTLEIAESRNYIFTKEINLGNNGFYVNGAKIT